LQEAAGAVSIPPYRDGPVGQEGPLPMRERAILRFVLDVSRRSRCGTVDLSSGVDQQRGPSGSVAGQEAARSELSVAR
jgi:hypothetical protein